MEQALENYDICTELLQSSTAIQAEAGTEQRDIIIRLPNLYNDSVVSLEEVSGSYLTVFLGQRFILGWLSWTRPAMSPWSKRAAQALSRAPTSQGRMKEPGRGSSGAQGHLGLMPPSPQHTY